jgi:hypothetical protein
MDENVQSNATPQEPMMPKPDNNMVLAIFTTVCCCLPLGIVGIIKASKVNDYYYMKQYEMAQQAADDAKKWSLIGLGIGIVFEIIYFIIYGATLFSTFSAN